MERMFHMLLYRAFHAQRAYLRPSLSRLGLGSGQPKLLAYLAANGPCPQKDLAAYFEIDRAAVSRMVETLEKGGFLARRTDEGNRRADLVTLTEKGRQANEAWQQACKGLEARMLKGFAPEEQRQFADYLARAYQNLKG